jgi:hypothetical protein
MKIFLLQDVVKKLGQRILKGFNINNMNKGKSRHKPEGQCHLVKDSFELRGRMFGYGVLITFCSYGASRVSSYQCFFAP